ncbi:hypothetical protein BH09MYX1_BH09MYX1_62710 [soil metagenome]
MGVMKSLVVLASLIAIACGARTEVATGSCESMTEREVCASADGCVWYYNTPRRSSPAEAFPETASLHPACFAVEKTGDNAQCSQDERMLTFFVGSCWELACIHVPAERDPCAEAGVLWGFGAGLRLKRPHDKQTVAGISPWLDADALYMRTGPLNRPGFDVAVGVSIPIGEARTFWIGPFARRVR